jgi:hypothetical protein
VQVELTSLADCIVTLLDPLWQAMCCLARTSLGLFNPAAELSSHYSNLLEFMMSMQHVGGSAAAHLLNGEGGTGLGRGVQLQAHEFLQRHNFTSISTRTLSGKQPAPELEGGISSRELLRLLYRLQVRPAVAFAECITCACICLRAVCGWATAVYRKVAAIEVHTLYAGHPDAFCECAVCVYCTPLALRAPAAPYMQLQPAMVLFNLTCQLYCRCCCHV